VWRPDICLHDSAFWQPAAGLTHPQTACTKWDSMCLDLCWTPPAKGTRIEFQGPALKCDVTCLASLSLSRAGGRKTLSWTLVTSSALYRREENKWLAFNCFQRQYRIPLYDHLALD
jgi:hypothetical protein